MKEELPSMDLAESHIPYVDVSIQSCKGGAFTKGQRLDIIQKLFKFVSISCLIKFHYIFKEG